MPVTIYGLPAHVLLIHAVVVLAPLGALFTVLSATWPAARARLGIVTPLTCALVLVLVPVTVNAGNWLRARIDPTRQNPKITAHQNLGNTFVYFALGLTLVSAGVWWLGRRYEFGLLRAPATPDPAPGQAPSDGGGVAVAARTRVATQRAALPTLPWPAAAAVMTVAVVVAALTVWQLYRIGDSGAHALWDGIVQR